MREDDSVMIVRCDKSCLTPTKIVLLLLLACNTPCRKIIDKAFATFCNIARSNKQGIY